MHERQEMHEDEEAQEGPAGGGGEQAPASIQSIATQAAAAMAAAMVAQQLLASAAATCGLDLASLSQFAIMAASQSSSQQQANPSVPQTPEQLMAAAVAAATFLSHSSPASQLNAATAGQLNASNLQALLNANASPAMGLGLGQAPVLPEDLTTLAESVQQQQQQQRQQEQQSQFKLEQLAGQAAGGGQSGGQNLALSQLGAHLNLSLTHMNLQNNSHSAHHNQPLGGATGNAAQGANGPPAGLNGALNGAIGPIRNKQHYHRHSSSSASSATSDTNQHNHQANNQHQHQHQHQHPHQHQTRHLLGHHHHSSIQTQQQLLATRGYNPLAVHGSGQQTEILTPTHLRKAKLMFFYVRYPNSSTLKECFRDVRFNKNNTAQLVKWFSNFREFYYIQMEKFARDAINDERIRCKEDIVVNCDHELINVLNNHYNKNRHIELPEVFRQVVEETLRHFFDAIHTKRDQEQSWKKAIYKVIARLDQEVPEFFKTDEFNEHLE